MLMRNDGLASCRKNTARYSTPGEKKGNILEFQSFRLRVEEVDHWNENRVQHGKNDKRAPTDVRYILTQISALKLR